MADRRWFETSVRQAIPDGSALTDESATAKTLVRAAASTAAARAMGVPFGSSRRVGSTLVCGSRPDEWLVLGDPASVLESLDRSGHVSAVDMTHGRALLRLTGDHAASVLEKLCSLDLSEPMTPDGAVASASIAKVTCDLVRDDSDGTLSYLIVCDRSYGDWLVGALLDAGGEFEPG